VLHFPVFWANLNIFRPKTEEMNKIRLTTALALLLSGLVPTAGMTQDTARQIPLWPNGAAVIIFPGGGHRLLVFNAEGRDPARFLNSIGVAAFIVKYRLFREDSAIYTFDKQTREDAYRAMRLVRSRAAEWNLDTARIGTLGFSAGGEVAALLAYTPGMGDPAAPDPVDRLNGRPNFQLLVYPGPLGIPATVPANAPPAFLLVADNDQGASPVIVSLLDKYRAAGAPVEAHILSGGNHGFNMGYRSNLKAVKNWPQQMADWLWDMHILEQGKK
jgi:acetyl esterase/lipase